NRECRSLFPGAMITITVVRMSPDLALARVYLSIFTKGDKNVFLENVQNQARSLRHELGKKIRHQMRKIPELAFFIDDSLDYIDNINSLLNK
ncbi:MAG: ribosome-binding factor A, partial [Bacteroidota bacterium]